VRTGYGERTLGEGAVAADLAFEDVLAAVRHLLATAWQVPG
jgi:hypothetical protein